MKYVLNWIPLRICVRLRNTQPHLKWIYPLISGVLCGSFFSGVLCGSYLVSCVVVFFKKENSKIVLFCKRSAKGFCKPYSMDQSVSEQHGAWILSRCKFLQKSYIHTCSTPVTAERLGFVILREAFGRDVYFLPRSFLVFFEDVIGGNEKNCHFFVASSALTHIRPLHPHLPPNHTLLLIPTLCRLWWRVLIKEKFHLSHSHPNIPFRVMLTQLKAFHAWGKVYMSRVWIPNLGALPIIASVSPSHIPCLFACFYESVSCLGSAAARRNAPKQLRAIRVGPHQGGEKLGSNTRGLSKFSWYRGFIWGILGVYMLFIHVYSWIRGTSFLLIDSICFTKYPGFYPKNFHDASPVSMRMTVTLFEFPFCLAQAQAHVQAQAQGQFFFEDAPLLIIPHDTIHAPRNNANAHDCPYIGVRCGDGHVEHSGDEHPQAISNVHKTHAQSKYIRVVFELLHVGHLFIFPFFVLFQYRGYIYLYFFFMISGVYLIFFLIFSNTGVYLIFHQKSGVYLYLGINPQNFKVRFYKPPVGLKKVDKPPVFDIKTDKPLVFRKIR